MPKRRFAIRLTRLISHFGRNSRANVAVTFAIATLPILAAVGCAVDYSLAVRMRSKMQAAADAASVGSISQSSPGYAAAEAMSGNGSVAAGVTDATNIFMANLCGPQPGGCTNVTGYSDLTVTATVTKTGSTLASVVNFTAQVPTTFLKVIGFQTLTISSASSSSAAMSTYLDFYLMLDVSGSMGLPSTSGPNSEEFRLSPINPDNKVQYPTGCTLACHFTLANSACVDDPKVTPPTNYPANPPTNTTAYTQQYSTSSYCMGYVYSRLTQSALSALINHPSGPITTSNPIGPKQVPGLPDTMLPNLNTLLDGSPNSLVTGNSASLPYSLTPVTSCPTPGTDACIQLRLDAVGFAVTQLIATAQSTEAQTNVPNQFRIGLYPFIEELYPYFPLTSSITTSSPINTAAANLATLLDTNTNGNLGSGGTHVDAALNSMNTTITSVGNGSSSTSTQPFVFLVTDGAQDPQTKVLNTINGQGWNGSNHATVLNNGSEVSFPNACQTLKNRGIIIGVLYIPYEPISPVNSGFANDEDDAANNNIPNISPSLTTCASPNFFFIASTPAAITAALQQMFKQSLTTAHITN
jgi:Flp pilus assembly protein TadG